MRWSRRSLTSLVTGVVLATTIATAIAGCGKDSTFPDAKVNDAHGGDSGGDGPLAELPTLIDLGIDDCGSTDTTTFELTNTGAAELSWSATSSNPAVFTVSPASGTVLVGTTTTVTITATIPSDISARSRVSGSLAITTNIIGLEQVTVPIEAMASGGELQIEPAAVGFGEIEVGDDQERTVTFHNVGDQALLLSVSGPSEGAFTVDGPAVGAHTIAAGASLSAIAHYAPGETGELAATLGLSVEGALCGTTPPATVAVTATAVEPGGVLVQGGPLDFGVTDCGDDAPEAQQLTVVNNSAITATWSAAFPTPGDLFTLIGDEVHYQVSPSSGSVAPGESQTITVTPLAIALPAEPRAYDVDLVITTVAATTVDHDVALSRDLDGAVLDVQLGDFQPPPELRRQPRGAVNDPPTLDFGFIPEGQTFIRGLRLANAGTQSTTLTLEVNGSRFDLTSTELTLGSDHVSTPGVIYSSNAVPSEGSVVITGTTLCSGPVTVPLTAGSGAYGQISNGTVDRDCPPSELGGGVGVTNQGNQPLVISSCQDASGSDLHPVFADLPLTISAENEGSLSFTIDAPSPLHAGSVDAFINCAVNHPSFPFISFTLTRQLNGADVVLTPAAPFDFDCGQLGHSIGYTVTNNGNRDYFYSPADGVPQPLLHSYESETIGPGESANPGFIELEGPPSSLRIVGGPSCSSSVPDGTLLVNGSLGVGVGSGNTVCSLSDPTPVRLFK